MKSTSARGNHMAVAKNYVRFAIWFICMALPGMAFSQVLAPVFSPGSGKAAVGFDVTVTCGTSGATIRYTTNGATPTINDPIVANNTVNIPRTLTLKAMAWVGSSTSPVTTGAYKVIGDIAGGGYHSLAVKSNRTATAWGYERYGALGNGDGSTTDCTTPTTVMRYYNQPIVDAVGAAAGLRHSLLLTTSGEIYAFGLNTSGQLGNNSITTPSDFFPVNVLKSTNTSDLLTNCVQVSAADTYSAALGDNGNVYTWGDDLNGRLGRIVSGSDNLYAKVVKTTVPATLTGIVQIAAGKYHMLARTASASEVSGGQGYVWVWGQNSDGRLGLGNTTDYTRAIRATLLSDITDISASKEHSAVVKWNSSIQGRVYCFGQQEFGRLGNNLASVAVVSSPVAVVRASGDLLDQIVAVAAGPCHTLALDNTGKVWSWGRNSSGELGKGDLTDRSLASKVVGEDGTGTLSNIVSIAAGGIESDAFSMAIAGDGTVYCWGANSHGQLGLGNTSTAKMVPSAVGTIQLTNIGPPSLTLSATLAQPYGPTTVTLNASLSDPDGEVLDCQSVKFYNGSTLIGQANPINIFGDFSLNWPSVAAGTYTITGIATDKSGTQGTKNLTVTVPAFPIVSIQTINGSLTEDGITKGIFRVSRSTPSSSPLSVNFSLSGTAVAGQDYQQIPLFALIPANQTSVDVTITGIGDYLEEPVETVVISLTGSSGYTVNGAASSVSVTITSLPVVSVQTINGSLTEDGITKGILRISRNTANSSQLTVNFSLSGTAVAGQDYQQIPLSAQIPANQTSVDVAITGIGDYLEEPDETVVISLSGASGYIVNSSASSASVTITSLSVVSVQTIQASISEDGLSNGIFRISRSTATVASLSVSFTLTGSALNGRDYGGSDGNSLPLTATIPTNQVSVDITVIGKIDYLTEPPEDVVITLPYTATQIPTAGAASATATITDVTIYDLDGLTLAQEAALGTSPVLSDTDGDGVNDNLDAFPLDPTRSAPSSGTPGDSSPPIVTLRTPVSATKLAGP